MTDPIFGVVLRRVDNDPRPAIYADMSTIGIIGPAADADATAFPVDTPVKMNTDDYTMIAKLGTAGFLQDAIRGINDQLGELQRAAQVIVVRTALGANADANLALQMTVGNIMGSSASGTGIHAFLRAPDEVQATPRIIICPGYTGLLANGVDAVTTGNAGAGYVYEQVYPLTFSGGGTNAVQAVGYAVGQADGTLGDPVLTSPGGFYTTAPTIAVAAPGAGGTQATYTATIDALANPIVSSLPSVLDQLLAHAIVETAGTSRANDEAWREAHSSDRIIAVTGGVKVADPLTGATITRPVAGRIAGILVRRDHETGGPFHSAANQAVRGILGPARAFSFNINSGENEGQQLLGMNFGILAKGEVGSDFSIANGGFVFIGTDNIGEDELWRFYNQTRGRDFIHLTMLRMLRFYLGKFNISAQTIRAVTNGMENVLRDLAATESILGYKISFSGSTNSAEEIRKGHISVAFSAEEPPVLRKITSTSSRYRPAIDNMVAQLESQLNLAA